MPDIFYIQPQARRLRKCLYPSGLPSTEVCPEYARGLSAEDFWKARGELRQIFDAYYTRVEADPASLGLPCVEINQFRSTSTEARASNAALLHFPAALFAIGACASFEGGALSVEIAALRKFFAELKGKYLPQQLAALGDFGFAFESFDGKKLPKAGTFKVFYSDHPSVLAVAAAVGDKLSRYMPAYLAQPKTAVGISMLEQFIFLTPGVFADRTENLPPKTLAHFAAAVGGAQAKTLVAIVEQFRERGLELRMDTAFEKNRFFNQKGKDTLNDIEYAAYRSIWPEGNGQLFLRLKLNRPDAYMEKIKALPPHLYSIFTEVWCGHCAEQCNRRIVYHLDGEEKRACGCFFFAAKNPSPEDIGPLMALYDLEQQARARK